MIIFSNTTKIDKIKDNIFIYNDYTSGNPRHSGESTINNRFMIKDTKNNIDSGNKIGNEDTSHINFKCQLTLLLSIEFYELFCKINIYSTLCYRVQGFMAKQLNNYDDEEKGCNCYPVIYAKDG